MIAMTTTVTSMRSVVRVIAVLVLPMLVLRLGNVPRCGAGLLRYLAVITVMVPAGLGGRRVVALAMAPMIRWSVHTAKLYPWGVFDKRLVPSAGVRVPRRWA
ncbi:Uncharacterised protein [Mycobacteroides abscessus subsp. abscessus]|nr:Uncharacterised protein [Mycobacteroides abscessus]SHV00028.1 Uncharacterised protein [Mycobacteroides abscessus subsp. abscessus]CPW42280.1 Uncharacterised protein [Mycobacteroides abscessus]CPZ59654.1 Uncharacterised protein [Mycobacteroides abscessus]CPZ91254.1 Uncharacterised protein [Mycobacteroides abscessus]